MTDQTRWGIDLIHTKNKAIKRQKDIISRALLEVDKLEEQQIVELMTEIEAIYEQKYGENKANKVILQDNEVQNGCRQGVGRVSQRCRTLVKTASKVYNCGTIKAKCRHLRYPCDTLATGGVSKLFVNNTNGYSLILPLCDTFQLFFIFSATKK